MTKERMVLVKWIDSGGDGRWLDRDSVIKEGGIAECESAGFLFEENEDRIMLALSINKGNNDVQGYLAIPKVAIQSIRDLRLK